MNDLVTLTHAELLTITSIALDAVEIDSADHAELKTTMRDIYERNFSKAEKEQAEADVAMLKIETGVRQSYEDSPYRALCENVLRKFGPDCTGQDLADYGNSLLRKSGDA